MFEERAMPHVVRTLWLRKLVPDALKSENLIPPGSGLVI